MFGKFPVLVALMQAVSDTGTCLVTVSLLQLIFQMKLECHVSFCCGLICSTLRACHVPVATGLLGAVR